MNYLLVVQVFVRTPMTGRMVELDRLGAELERAHAARTEREEKLVGGDAVFVDSIRSAMGRTLANCWRGTWTVTAWRVNTVDTLKLGGHPAKSVPAEKAKEHATGVAHAMDRDPELQALHRIEHELFDSGYDRTFAK